MGFRNHKNNFEEEIYGADYSNGRFYDIVFAAF